MSGPACPIIFPIISPDISCNELSLRVSILECSDDVEVDCFPLKDGAKSKSLTVFRGTHDRKELFDISSQSKHNYQVIIEFNFWLKVVILLMVKRVEGVDLYSWRREVFIFAESRFQWPLPPWKECRCNLELSIKTRGISQFSFNCQSASFHGRNCSFSTLNQPAPFWRPEALWWRWKEGPVTSSVEPCHRLGAIFKALGFDNRLEKRGRGGKKRVTARYIYEQDQRRYFTIY